MIRLVIFITATFAACAFMSPVGIVELASVRTLTALLIVVGLGLYGIIDLLVDIKEELRRKN